MTNIMFRPTMSYSTSDGLSASRSASFNDDPYNYVVDPLDEASLKAQIPARRFGKPEEVAALVGFLASPDSAYITGQVISINGGLY